MEILANELIFDTFEYLSVVDLFHGFQGLNQRFDALLREYLRVHPYVDFRLAYKDDITLMRRHNLPMVAADLRGMYLSDDGTTPHLIDSFLSRVFPLTRFENLATISVENVSSLEKILRLLDDIHRLSRLTDLHLHRCSIETDQKSIVKIIDTIWRLPQLTTCTLDLSFPHHNHFIPPTIISCSIRHLIIKSVLCLQANLPLLHESTPFLESLSVQIWNPDDDDDDENVRSSSMSPLNTFDVRCEDPSVCFRSLFRSLPTLTRLNIRTKTIHLNGNDWQTLIRQRLPQLNSFHLYMELNFNDIPPREEAIDRILSTYRTPFWIDEHRWFIQIHWNEEAEENSIVYLYTLPFAFEQFALDIDENFRVKSTCPTPTDFRQVTSLQFSWNVDEVVVSPNISFDRLTDLSITLPLNKHFRSILPRLDRLVSLEVRLVQFTDDDDKDEFVHLQQILDRSSRLFSLKFHSWPLLNKKDRRIGGRTAPFTVRSQSVRQLDLRGSTSSGQSKHFYSNDQCVQLLKCPLASQCEFLQIRVEKRTNVLELVKKMPRLRTGNFQCREQKTGEANLSKWLKENLPPNVTFSKHVSALNETRLWIS